MNTDALAPGGFPGQGSIAPKHGAELFTYLKTMLRNSSDAAQTFFAQSYLDDLDRMMKKLTDMGGVVEGQSSVQDRASLSIDPAERRRRTLAGKHIGVGILDGESTAQFADRHAKRLGLGAHATNPSAPRGSGKISAERRKQLLGMTHLGIETLANKPATFSAPPPVRIGDGVANFVGGSPLAKCPGVSFDYDAMQGAPAGSGVLQGIPLWSACLALVGKAQDDVDDDPDLYEDSYLRNLENLEKEFTELGGFTLEEGEPAFKNYSTNKYTGRFDTGTGDGGKPRGNQRANRGQGDGAATLTDTQAVRSDLSGQKPLEEAEAMTPARRKKLLGDTIAGQIVLNSEKRSALPEPVRMRPGLGENDKLW